MKLNAEKEPYHENGSWKKFHKWEPIHVQVTFAFKKANMKEMEFRIVKNVVKITIREKPESVSCMND